MRKLFIKHENLRRCLEELYRKNEEEIPDELIERFVNELKHSQLIIAADKNGDDYNFCAFEHEGGNYAVLFTDMDEFRKSFSDDEFESHAMDFSLFHHLVKVGLLDGYLLNPQSEGFLLKKELFLEITDLPEHNYNDEDAFRAMELKIKRFYG